MRKLSGFTLIEMLIVISIIGILAAALIPRMSSSKNKAINVATEKSMRDVTNALFLYYADKGSYPTATTCDTNTKTDCGLASIQSQLAQYLSSIPTPSYTQLAWSFGSGNNVPANQFGYAGLGSRYILSYHFIDTRDGKKYKVVNMPDSQRWMAENLNYKSSASACYMSNNDNCDDGWGRFYNRTDAQTVCPAGRHLSLNSEWATLLNKIEVANNGTADHAGSYVNPSNQNFQPPYGSVAGNLLRTIQGGGLDAYGFSALLAGDGSAAVYRGSYGNYRTTENINATNGATRCFVAGGRVHNNTYPKGALFGVRCVKD